MPGYNPDRFNYSEPGESSQQNELNLRRQSVVGTTGEHPDVTSSISHIKQHNERQKERTPNAGISWALLANLLRSIDESLPWNSGRH